MPKIKTHSGAKKRFKLSKNGKPIRAHAYKSHILNKKSTKRKRNLRRSCRRNESEADQASCSLQIINKLNAVFDRFHKFSEVE